MARSIAGTNARLASGKVDELARSGSILTRQFRLLDIEASTLYIDNFNVKLLTIRDKKIVHAAALPLEAGWMLDGIIKEPDKMAACINKLLEGNRIDRSRVIVGLSGLNCLTKIITLPAIPDSSLDEAVKREAERELPLPLADLYLSWQAIPGEASGERRVFIAAYSRNIADALIKTLNTSGLRPYMVDLAPLALTQLARGETGIWVDVRQGEMDIAITVNGTPELVRTLPLDGVQTSESLVLTLKEELHRIIKFFDSRRPQSPLDQSVPVYISGILAHSPGSFGKLNESGHPVLPTASLLPLTFVESTDIEPYMINIGLAFKRLATGTAPQISLNFLPEVYKAKPASLSRIFIPLIATACLAALVTGGIQLKSAVAQTDTVNGQIAAVTEQITVQQTHQQLQMKEISALESSVKQAQASREALGAARSRLDVQQDALNLNLEQVKRLCPSEVTLSSVRHTDKVVTVRGLAVSEGAVIDYAAQLEGTGSFSRVTISSLKTNENDFEFALSLRTNS